MSKINHYCFKYLQANFEQTFVAFIIQILPYIYFIISVGKGQERDWNTQDILWSSLIRKMADGTEKDWNHKESVW